MFDYTIVRANRDVITSVVLRVPAHVGDVLTIKESGLEPALFRIMMVDHLVQKTGREFHGVIDSKCNLVVTDLA